MQREEKQLETLIDAVLSRLNDLKLSIGAMIHKIETEYEVINWPTFLDNFALISSHLTGLSKILAHELGPPLRNLTVLPLQLSQERDEAIFHLTESRIAIFAHDLVPDYLRTKPEPAAEQRMLTHEQKANNMVPDTAAKQVSQFTKVISHVYDMVNKAREEWDVEASSRAGIQQTSNIGDTHALVAAVGMGKGLVPDSGSMVPPVRPTMPTGPAPATQTGKAPSAIKTNIKSANQIHPYSR
ncbi:mediator of RNA polymerase II transcription subunit 8 [Contarinia nasturtii]|uniref:mediator of RNA polymerase II transcription subunit 8 n=1 Tax=Contarinia nasturtii TaxID=265458 RepID=UPI0012D3CF00|nr:mediator of RNA polymerase II transcription subunit 8 [Contarinia nasturtii]